MAADADTDIFNWLTVKVLRPTQHKIDHFWDVPQANLFAWYGKTKPKGQIPLRYLVADRFEAGLKLVADSFEACHRQLRSWLQTCSELKLAYHLAC